MKDEFQYNYIFEVSKEKAFRNSIQFRNYLATKYGITSKEIGTKLYTAIINYQVKKYGGSINPIYVFYSKETANKVRINSNSRKQARKNRKGFWLKESEEKK